MSKQHSQQKRSRKNDTEQKRYREFLLSGFELDQTEKDNSVAGSDTSTIQQKQHKLTQKKRPKKLPERIRDFREKHGITTIILTAIISIIAWLFNNDYNFNRSLGVAENKIEHIENELSEYRSRGIISKEDYVNYQKEIQTVKSKLDSLGEESKIFKVITEKDISSIKEILNDIEKKLKS